MKALRFRNVYGDPVKDKYNLVKPSSAQSESCLIKGNSLYTAVSWFSAGGGCLAVLPHGKERKLEPDLPMIKGHSGAVLDFDFYPFDENILASSSEDSSIKLWQIPTEFTENLIDPLVSLDGHNKKVHLVTWNPTSESVLASCSFDNTVKVWNAQKPEQFLNIGGFSDPALSLEWNQNGSLLGTVWKDKMLRILDPRIGQVVQEVNSHEGPKSQKFTWMTGDYCLTVGFSKDFHRQFYLWNLKNLEKPVSTLDIDQASGTLYPFFDHDLGMLYLAGKGDGNVRYYEFFEGNLHFCMNYQTTVSGKGYGFLPKRCVDVKLCEVMRGLKLTSDTIEYIRFIAPRKSEAFQEDLYPECNSEIPAQSADEWFNGSTVSPKKKSLAPGSAKVASIGKGFPVAQAEDVNELKKRIKVLEQELETKDTRIQELEKELVGKLEAKDAKIQELEKELAGLKA